ncbi:MAG: cyclic nucleotide-binding domain-containing protein, partial [Anaerolineae bacterium]|nr:cyclic nucleotide-binding domain-containing protein [Anaerolineae bacterium]
TWQQSSSGEIGLEGEEGDDWVTRMLQLTLFQKLPPDNLQKVIQRMQSVHVNKGETIIRQGDEGDFYYVIRQGRCEVARIGSDGRRYKLAELAKGDSFGEESLVSGSKRNANVTMLSNG